MPTIIQLKAASDAAIRNKTAFKSVTTANVSDQLDALGNELLLRGAPQVATTADLATESHLNTNLIVVPDYGIFKAYASLAVPDNIDTFASVTAGVIWVRILRNPIIDTTLQNGRVSGGYVTWTGTGFEFQVSPTVYVIDGQLRNSLLSNAILDPADINFNRIDVIYVDLNGDVGVLTGTPGPTPVKPLIDPATQLELVPIEVPALSTVPNFTTEVIYDENVLPEWTGSVVNTTGDFDAVSDPHRLTKHLDITNINNGGDRIIFLKPSGGTVDLSDYSGVSLFVKLKAIMTPQTNLRIRFYNGAIAATDELTLLIDKNNITDYQGVSIPLNSFAITNAVVDNVQIRWTNSVGTIHPGFLLDFVYLQSGLIQPQPITVYTADNGVTKDGFNFFWGGNLNRQSVVIGGGPNYNITFNSSHSVATLLVNNTRAAGAPAAIFRSTSDGITDTQEVVRVERSTNGTAGVNLGAAVNYYIEANGSTGTNVELSNQLVSKWTDPVLATRKSQYEIYGVHNAVTARKMAIASTGQVTLDGYAGAGQTFAGTPTWGLAVDVDGKLLQAPVVSAANNGLRLSGATVKLGGTGSALLEDTIIPTSVYNLTFNSSSGTGTILANNTSASGSASGIQGTATVGIGVKAYASGNSGTGMETSVTGNFATAIQVFNSGAGGYAAYVSHFGSSNSGIPMYVSKQTSGVPDELSTVLQLNRREMGVPQDGLGIQVLFTIDTTVFPAAQANAIVSQWVDIVDATRFSRMTIQGVDVGALQDIFYFNGDGQVSAPFYGDGTFTGTAAYLIGVTAAGDFIEVATGGGGSQSLSDVIGVGNTYTHTGTTDGVILTNNSSGMTLFIENNSSGWGQYIQVDAAATGGGLVINGSATVDSAAALRINNLSTGLGLYIVSISGGDGFRYEDGNEGAGKVLTSDAAGNATWQTATGGVFNSDFVALSTSTPTWDIDNGANATWTITGTANTLTITNPVEGRYYTLLITQDDGNDTVATWPTGTTWFGGSPPTLSTGAGDVDMIVFLRTTGGYIASHQPLNGTIAPLAGGGTGASLTAPGADRIFFWDQSASSSTWLEVGSGLTITGTVLSATGGGGGGATTALDNLAAVAINTSLISDANNTDDLGSSANSWKDVYSYSIKLKGSTSGTTTLVATAAAGTTTATLQASTGTIALLQNNLGAFAATTSSQLASVISDETGTGLVVFNTSPTLTSPTFAAGGTGAGTAASYYTAGSLLTSPVSGAVEFDGRVFYRTTDSGRGVVPAFMEVVLDSDFGLSDVNTAQAAFPSGFDVFTLQGDTTYEFEGVFNVACGTASHAFGMGFAQGGAGTLASIRYSVMGWAGVDNNVASIQATSRWTSVTPNTLQMAASSVAGNNVIFKGIVRVAAGSSITLQPQIIFGAAPGGTNLMKADSFIKFWPLGSASFTAVGNIA